MTRKRARVRIARQLRAFVRGYGGSLSLPESMTLTRRMRGDAPLAIVQALAQYGIQIPYHFETFCDCCGPEPVVPDQLRLLISLARSA